MIYFLKTTENEDRFMDKKIYLRGKAGTYWYNFTEGLAYALTYKPTPKGIIYNKRIPYGGEKMQYYNTYCREDLLNEKKPLFIYVHGGGWVSGITDMRNTYIQNFAKLGFFTANISYTYAPDKVFPLALGEICKAVDKILDSAQMNNIDVGRIVVAGESAGVFYAFFLAALAADKSLAGKLGIDFKHIDDFKISALISHCGCINLPKLLDPACPQSHFPDMKMMVCSLLGKSYEESVKFLETEEGKLTYPQISEDFPPAFFTTAQYDKLRYEGYDMMREYAKFGIPYDAYEGTGIIGNHAWTIVTKFKKGRECLDKTLKFIMPLIEETSNG